MASVQLRSPLEVARKPLARPRESHSWITRYCERLIALVPSMRVDAALQRAILAFPYCADMDPAIAADKYVAATHGGKHPSGAQPLIYRFTGLLRR